MEGVPGDLLRERGRREAVRAHARLGVVLRTSSRSRPAFLQAFSTSCTGSATRRARRSSRIRDVDLVSFTGSAAAGRAVNEAAARRLAKTCLELGGKNALVVCDDADLDSAVSWALASAFSNAGQRCASASRIVVFDAVYDAFRERLVDAAAALDSQPVISRESMERILAARDPSA